MTFVQKETRQSNGAQNFRRLKNVKRHVPKKWNLQWISLLNLCVRRYFIFLFLRYFGFKKYFCHCFTENKTRSVIGYKCQAKLIFFYSYETTCNLFGYSNLLMSSNEVLHICRFYRWRQLMRFSQVSALFIQHFSTFQVHFITWKMP